MIITNKKLTGQWAEQQAQSFLKKQGLRLVKRNFNCPVGEIDLIMRNKNTLVFIEVRYRKEDSLVSALETIDNYKQQKIIKAAKYFLVKHPIKNIDTMRFDVVAIEMENNLPQLNWISNAFYMEAI